MTTYTRDQARTEIEKLVAQFKHDEAALLHTEEANIENNFVRPLFRLLNWNVDNTGLSEPQWEFVLQRTMREGNRPDYILQLDGQQVFVMDAKKAKYDMHDPRWLNQVYAYAYSTQNNAPSKKIDFAILTDFQEFIVLDCTLYANKPQAISAFRVIDWRYDDYVNRFDELWDLFERNNVLASSRERKTGIWSRYLSPKKVQANRVPPDKAFLAALDDEKEGWRVRLAKDMKKHDASLDGHVLTAAVQLLIDRLIFVKVLSDREIEQDYLATMAQIVERDGLTEDDCGWFAACKNLFAELNAMYNGSIFAPRPELEAVAVSNKVVRDIIGDLLPENSPYNFAVLPVEILGTIYERFLGRVVNATAARVKIEDKPEVRKAGGVYYTPQYIVNYIVQNTVGKLLADCKSPADVAQLKILDPACGSGSFLLGAYAVLIEWHRAYYQGKTSEVLKTLEVSKRDRDAYYLDDDGRVRLTAKLKRQILLNNIFGVDIDAQAVEVTRLSLSLKALEDTRSDEAHNERTLFNQTLLPDLSGNIKCGNSLIGTDYLVTSDEELKRVKPFDWASEFPEIFNREGAKSAKEKQGFDAVIGNPPYVRQESLKHIKDYLSQRYTAYSSSADLYVYFIEKGTRLLNDNGLFSIIVSSSFLRANYGESLREYIQQSTAVISLVDFGGLAIFENAKDTYVCIPLLSKQTQPDNVAVCQVKSLDDLKLDEFVAQNNYPVSISEFNKSGWSIANTKITSVFAKLKYNGIPLGKYVDNGIYYGLKTGLNEAFEIDEAKRDEILKESPKSSALIKRFLGGQDIRRYIIRDSQRYLIVIPAGWTSKQIGKDSTSERDAWNWLSKNHKAIAKHLEPFASDAKKRQDQGEFWWELRSCDYYDKLEQPKIIYPDIAKQSRFFFDTNGIYLANTAYCLATDDLYLLGILNSQVAWFSISRTSIPFGVRAGEYRYRLIYQYMEQLPIRTINFADAADKSCHDKIVQLVQQMLDLHKRLHAAKTETDKQLYQRQIDATDKQIDTLVYQLYELTDEEIRIVEGA